MLDKRLSVRSFDKSRRLSIESVMYILKEYNACIVPEYVKIERGDSFFSYDDRLLIRVTDASSTSASIGDVALSFYAKEDFSLSHEAIGYEGEALDLLFESKGIGFLWYGMGRVKERLYKGYRFQIMAILGAMKSGSLRRGEEEYKRLSLDEIWKGDFDINVKRSVRLAPSACNSQPWLFESSGDEIALTRVKSHSPMLFGKTATYFNTIDIGIALRFLTLSLEHEGYEKADQRELFSIKETPFRIRAKKVSLV